MDMTPADFAALNGNDGMFGGNGIWFLALLFLFGGGFGYGARGGAPVTEADLCNANSFNDLKSGVRNVSDQIGSMNVGLTKGICDLGYTIYGQFAALERQLADCCCTTQRAIDGVNYNVSTSTAAINANTTAQVQKILDAITGNRMADMQAQINQLQLQSALCGVVRYPTTAAYATTCNPFFGGYGCAGNCAY